MRDLRIACCPWDCVFCLKGGSGEEGVLLWAEKVVEVVIMVSVEGFETG